MNGVLASKFSIILNNYTFWSVFLCGINFRHNSLKQMRVEQRMQVTSDSYSLHLIVTPEVDQLHMMFLYQGSAHLIVGRRVEDVKVLLHIRTGSIDHLHFLSSSLVFT